MPLRLRLIALVGLVLLVSLACGSLLVAWHEANSVRTELRAALDVGARTVHNGLAGLPHVADPQGELRRLIDTFNGNRHVRAALFDVQGNVTATSELSVPPHAVPQWFSWLIGGRSATVDVAPPPAIEASGRIVLTADPTNEIGEVWAESRDAVLVLAGFAGLSALLISLVVGRALRSLETLSAAFDRVGKGHHQAPLPVLGPPELARLANGFNRMTERLAAAAAQNHRLNERLFTLQAEERADLARDLHDEVGPLLFAVDMTAATIEHLADSEREPAIRTHVAAIHDAVGRMQLHIRAILSRLRPLEAVGLAAAIERLAAFWRGRRADIVVTAAVALEEDRIDSHLKETIYRVVQEGMSNAIRHGAPRRVDIAVTRDADDAVRVAVTDDGVGMADGGTTPLDAGRLGLIGMRERVRALAGSLAVGPRPDGSGIALVVRLPCETARRERVPQ